MDQGLESHDVGIEHGARRRRVRGVAPPSISETTISLRHHVCEPPARYRPGEATGVSDAAVDLGGTNHQTIVLRGPTKQEWEYGGFVVVGEGGATAAEVTAVASSLRLG